jgi:hypothetical protein
MAKFTPDITLDAYLDFIAACTRMDIVSDVSTPTTLANTVATVTLTAGDGNGDFAITDGTSGRKLTVGAQTAVPITATGACNHIVLSLDGVIRYVTTGDGQTLYISGTVDMPAFNIQLNDPT